MAVVARAQQPEPRIGFTRIAGEAMRQVARQKQEGEPHGELQMTILKGDARPSDMHGMYGALIVSKVPLSSEVKSEFLLAIVGHDPDGKNVLDADNSAVVFADPSLMTPERAERAQATYARMAEMHGYGHGMSREDLVQTATTELLQNELFGQFTKPWTF